MLETHPASHLDNSFGATGIFDRLDRRDIQRVGEGRAHRDRAVEVPHIVLWFIELHRLTELVGGARGLDLERCVQHNGARIPALLERRGVDDRLA